MMRWRRFVPASAARHEPVPAMSLSCMEHPLPIDPPDPLAVEHVALAATGLPGRARVHSDPARSSTSNTAIQYTPMAPSPPYRPRTTSATAPSPPTRRGSWRSNEPDARPPAAQPQHSAWPCPRRYPRTEGEPPATPACEPCFPSPDLPTWTRVAPGKPWRKVRSCLRGRGNSCAVSDSTPITARTTLEIGSEHTSERPASHPARPLVMRRNALMFHTRRRGGSPPWGLETGSHCIRVIGRNSNALKIDASPSCPGGPWPPMVISRRVHVEGGARLARHAVEAVRRGVRAVTATAAAPAAAGR